MTTAERTLQDATAAIAAGRPSEAETILRHGLDQGLGDQRHAEMLARLIHNRAVQALAAKDVRSAEKLLRAALTAFPALDETRKGLADLLYRLAPLHRQAGKPALAAKSAWEARTLWPDLTRQLGPAMEPLGLDLLNDALARIAEDPLLACRLALAAWACRPDDGQTHATARSIFIHLGTGELGKPVEEAEFADALGIDPADVVALIGLANLHRRAGRLNFAETLYRKAMALHPHQPFAGGRLASVLCEQGRLREAEGLYRGLDHASTGIEAAIRLDPAFLDALSDPGRSLSAEPAGEGLVAFTSCDGRYFTKYIDALANSLAATTPDCGLHIHVVDPDGETSAHAERLRQRLPGLPIRLSAEPSPPGLDAEQRRVYYACARFLRLPDLLEGYGKPLLMLDIDMVVLRGIAPLLAQLDREDADLAMIHGQPRDPWCCLWADVVAARPTPLALAYLRKVRAYIAYFFERRDPRWFLDQVALFAVRAAGFAGRPQPAILQWPMDLQNAHTDHTYFWSMHVSQPNNRAYETSEAYLRYKTLAGSDGA